MPIRFRCEKCSQGLTISTRKQGTRIPCPKCNQETMVPTIPTGIMEQITRTQENPSSKDPTPGMNSPQESPSSKTATTQSRTLSESILDIDFDLMIPENTNFGDHFKEEVQSKSKGFSLPEFLGRQSAKILIIGAIAYTILIIIVSSYISIMLTTTTKTAP